MAPSPGASPRPLHDVLLAEITAFAAENVPDLTQRVTRDALADRLVAVLATTSTTQEGPAR
ncbi:hypothetical protein [Peterkaempfera griseoplana]|uniref:hypothetical protein n=1 Tax=Peterkaempfera griseoplana TaxID=66896 RepID=UPI0006E1C7D7|nr:hypothetical protein [Peterkaempfera griseoplana]